MYELSLAELFYTSYIFQSLSCHLCLVIHHWPPDTHHWRTRTLLLLMFPIQRNSFEPMFLDKVVCHGILACWSCSNQWDEHHVLSWWAWKMMTVTMMDTRTEVRVGWNVRPRKKRWSRIYGVELAEMKSCETVHLMHNNTYGNRQLERKWKWFL